MFLKPKNLSFNSSSSYTLKLTPINISDNQIIYLKKKITCNV